MAKSERGMGWKYWSFIIGAFLATAAVGGLYWIHFGENPIGGPMRWGQFGDYFGGVLGPIFALGALIGVLLTLRHQREELHQARSQKRLGLLMNVADRVYADLDSNLDSDINVLLPPNLPPKYSPKLVVDFGGLQGTKARDALNPHSLDFPIKFADRWLLEQIHLPGEFPEWVKALKAQLGVILSDIKELDGIVSQMLQESDSQVLVDFYRKRTKSVVQAALILQYISRNDTSILFPWRSFKVATPETLSSYSVTASGKFKLENEEPRQRQ